MRGNWGGTARAWIAEVDAALAPDASLADRRKALRERLHAFAMGTSWGQRVWQRECRAYLERHGLEPLPPKHLRPGTKAFIPGQISIFDKLAD